MHYVEVQLAGAIGGASARIMVASVVKEETLTIEEVRDILDEASQVVVYSHRLEQKSHELEAATAELREANERLKELDRLKDDFVSTVTHELRTPLTSIRAFTEILLDDPDVELGQRKKFLGIITKETERLTRLINQVLDLAKIESGNAEWAETDVDLKDVISDTLGAMGQVFKERNIEVTAHLPERVSLVTADLDRMIQVMLNLLSNAAKFCDAGNGRVEISLVERGASLQVDVRDNGRGISPEHQAEIFSKFHQVGDTLTDKPHGSGLGLHISRQIIEHFGGRLWVESELGRGACFSFTVPTRVPARARPHERPVADWSLRMSKKILIADDEPNIVAAIEFLLKQRGHDVYTATDGAEALSIVERVVPDLVLLDVMMPQASGYEVCQNIRRRPEWRHIKIIMLSAKGRDSEVVRGLTLGADFYVTKPFSTRDLMSRIEGLLEPPAVREPAPSKGLRIEFRTAPPARTTMLHCNITRATMRPCKFDVSAHWDTMARRKV